MVDGIRSQSLAAVSSLEQDGCFANRSIEGKRLFVEVVFGNR